jgi:hypothetical protein
MMDGWRRGYCRARWEEETMRNVMVPSLLVAQRYRPLAK